MQVVFLFLLKGNTMHKIWERNVAKYSWTLYIEPFINQLKTSILVFYLNAFIIVISLLIYNKLLLMK